MLMNAGEIEAGKRAAGVKAKPVDCGSLLPL
jgi:hypothetical protein